MFALTLMICALTVSAMDRDLFVQDVVFSILGTIIDGVEHSRRLGNRYDLAIQWQDNMSKRFDCSYCHYGIEDKELLRAYTDDERKLDYSKDPYVFPTTRNSDIPDYELNKEEILTYIWKELADLFTGVDIDLKGDTCCHTFSLVW
jgi:hypothetical protein